MYIREQSVNPEIPDTYMAVAVNDSTFKDAIVGISDSISRKDLLLACPIIITVSAVCIVIIVLCLCGYEKRLKILKQIPEKKQDEQNDEISDQMKATVLSLTIISLGKLIAFVCFDSAAIQFSSQTSSQTVDVKYLNDSVVGFVQAMQRVPVILLVFDIFALLFNLVLIGAAISRTYKKLCCKEVKDIQYYVLALTLVSLFSSCTIHAPYIIMAYVSDANYASSIFVYYMVEVFIEFSLNQYVFSVYFTYVTYMKHTKTKVQKFKFILPCLLAVFLAAVVNGLMITIFLYFYFLPIKYILNNGPSQFVLIYQSGVLLVGGYLTHRAVFKREPDKLQQSIEELNRLLKKKKKANGQLELNDLHDHSADDDDQQGLLVKDTDC